MAGSGKDGVVNLNRCAVFCKPEMIDALVRVSRMMHDDQFRVRLTVQHQVAVGINDHGVGILQVKADGSVGRDISCRGRTAEHWRHRDRGSTDLRLYDGGPVVGSVGRIGGANENIVTAEGDVVIAAAMRGGAEGVWGGMSLGFWINDHEVGTGILVLQCPYLMGVWIYAESIVVSGNSVGGDDIAIELVFDNCAALAVGAIGSGAIAIADKDFSVYYRDGVGGEVNSRNAGGENGDRVGSGGDNLRRRGRADLQSDP